jgi:hypothetical protein
MAQEQAQAVQAPRRQLRLSLDWWAVLASLLAAVLIWLGAIPNVGW